MADRLLKVNAYTTLDMVEVTTKGHEFEQDALGVVNATADRKKPDEVRLEIEPDDDCDAVPAHAEIAHLTADQAEELAEELRRHAGRVRANEDGNGDDEGDD